MRHVLFDTETTQLVENSLQPLHKQPHIFEIFGMVLDDKKGWKEVDRFHAFINPRVPISDEVIRITGVDPKALVNKPTWIDIAHEVQEFFASGDAVVAHNLSYDLSVVNFEMARIERAFRWPAKKVCTVEATEHLKGFRLNLTALHTELFGVGFEKAHSAENDVRAMGRCYVELHKRGEI